MRERPDKGFTLVEVVMATLLFVIAVGIVGSILMNITRMNFHSSRHTKAVILANNKLEELLGAGFHSPLLDADTYENPLNPITATGDSGGIFYQFWVIEAETPIPTSKRIISEIQWDGTDGTEKSVTLTALCIEDIN
ncbi:prepilin-type N-terminal cleavage/methylation domain-containing protein [Candidatus Omnitrophota bacterium]